MCNSYLNTIRLNKGKRSGQTIAEVYGGIAPEKFSVNEYKVVNRFIKATIDFSMVEHEKLSHFYKNEPFTLSLLKGAVTFHKSTSYMVEYPNWIFEDSHGKIKIISSENHLSVNDTLRFFFVVLTHFAEKIHYSNMPEVYTRLLSSNIKEAIIDIHNLVGDPPHLFYRIKRGEIPIFAEMSDALEELPIYSFHPKFNLNICAENSSESYVMYNIVWHKEFFKIPNGIREYCKRNEQKSEEDQSESEEERIENVDIDYPCRCDYSRNNIYRDAFEDNPEWLWNVD